MPFNNHINIVLFAAMFFGTAPSALSDDDCGPIYNYKPLTVELNVSRGNERLAYKKIVFTGNSLLPNTKSDKLIVELGHNVYFEVTPICTNNKSLMINYKSKNMVTDKILSLNNDESIVDVSGFNVNFRASRTSEKSTLE